jgi:RNA polymerase sigma-70 factor (ECF subfamily)
MQTNVEGMIQECLDGSEGAWIMLVNAYSKKIFNLAYQFSGSYEEAQDLTQDIFFKIHGSLRKYDFSRNFTAWLLTLARNYLIDQYRRTKWERKSRDDFDKHLLTAQSGHSPEEDIIKQENKKILWDGLNLLSNDLRMAIILRDIQGKKYEEIAEIAALPLGTVKSRVNRARLQLADILKERKDRQDAV